MPEITQKQVKSHTAMHQMKNVLLDLIAAENHTNNTTCLVFIRQAKNGIHKAAETLGIDLLPQNDPMM